MTEPKGPACPKCGPELGHIVDVVYRDNLNMTLVCCWNCGAVIAWRDNLLMEKLDKIIDGLKSTL